MGLTGGMGSTKGIGLTEGKSSEVEGACNKGRERAWTVWRKLLEMPLKNQFY